ncbi:MAG: MBL fold metallo-hydrolase [Cystobacterineae bacterium]|nr:MBL fold metallo-hydrolase [Cystobacterineae bacterium]
MHNTPQPLLPPLAPRLLCLPPLLAVLGGCTPLYSGPPTEHFDGTRFSNQPGVPSRPGAGEILKWHFSRRTGPAWQGFVDAPFGPPPPQRVEGLRLSFVGHATVLLQYHGLNLLTDPVWSSRVGPASWLGTQRQRPPGIRFEDLPPIELILLSHDHYDHLDLPTLRRLVEAFPNLTIITGLGNGTFLQQNGICAKVIELDWWQSTTLGSLTIWATPAAHWSGRNPFFLNRTLWVGFVVQGPEGALYYAGDTGWGPHFAQIYERFGPMHLALLPIGAYKPEWFMGAQHIGPKEALEASAVLKASHSVGLHFGTFDLADDGQLEATQAVDALRTAYPEVRFDILQEGEGRDFAAHLNAPTDKPPPGEIPSRPLSL